MAKSKPLKSQQMAKCPTERQEQDAVVKWARMMAQYDDRFLMLRCGFEGLRLSMGVRMQCKRQSICNGWPDIFLAVPRRYQADILVAHFCGLFIELKRRKGGTVSQEQAEIIGRLQNQGYMAVVCRGADEAIKTISAYLGI